MVACVTVESTVTYKLNQIQAIRSVNSQIYVGINYHLQKLRITYTHNIKAYFFNIELEPTFISLIFYLKSFSIRFSIPRNLRTVFHEKYTCD